MQEYINEQLKEFKTKHMGTIGKWISIFMTVGSLAVSVWGVVKAGASIQWKFVFGLVIANSVFWIFAAVYEKSIKYEMLKLGDKLEQRIDSVETDNNDKQKQLRSEHKQQIKQYEDDVSKLKEQLNEQKNEIFNLREQVIKVDEKRNLIDEKLRYYFNFTLLSLIDFMSQLNEAQVKFEEETAQNENEKELLLEKKTDLELVEKIYEKRNQDSENRYSEVVERMFNHFLGNIIVRLKPVLDEHLASKNIDLETSISVKQFDNVCFGKDDENLSNIRVLTTFRDKETYAKNDREVNKKVYKILENTAFQSCIEGEYFIKNNISVEDVNSGRYKNKNNDFLKYYNSTVVVPIKCKYSTDIEYFGYLTCDVLNENEQVEVFDFATVQILQSAAHVIGLFLDNMDSQYQYVLEDDFLRMIFNDKLKKSGITI